MESATADGAVELPTARASRRPPLPLLIAGLIVGAAVLLPAAYLAIVVLGDLGPALETAFDSRTAAVLARTAGLAIAVTGASIAIAVPIAWLTVRTDLPARRLWATLCTLPLVIPTYVGAYLFVAALGPDGLLADALGVGSIPSIYGFPGAFGRTHAVHLSARPAAGAVGAAADRSAARGRGAGDGPRAARDLPHRRPAAAVAGDRCRRPARRRCS